MLAMDSESSQTPDSTPQMLLEAHLFWCIFMLYSKVNGTQLSSVITTIKLPDWKGYRPKM